MAKGKTYPPPHRLNCNGTALTKTSTTNTPLGESKCRRSKSEEVETLRPDLLRHNPVDWGKIGAYLAILTLVGGVMCEFADVAISVRNLRDDVKELKRESENLVRTSVETSVRVTVLERGDTQQPLAMSSSCPAALDAKNPSESKGPESH
jgi:hypothetical protein